MIRVGFPVRFKMMAFGAALVIAGAAVVASGLVLSGSGSADLPATASHRTADRTVEFSGYAWVVKSSTTRIGPGPNYFSDSPGNVWTDRHGHLHLKLTHANGRWYCAEVFSKRLFGRGRYSFTLATPLHRLDPHVVVGLFTWNDSPAFHDREMDIEFGRFGRVITLRNGDYVVQPYYHNGNWQEIHQFAAASSTEAFDWQTRAVTFRSSTAVPSVWTYTGPDVPPPPANAHINLWLYRGASPLGDKPVEIIVTHFTFTPGR
jgi:hypothetical protein